MGLRRFLGETFTGPRLERETVETFDSSQFESQVAAFWSNMTGASGFSSPRLVENVWTANRCQHMNSNAISTMPLRHFGGREPAWVANPDPAWYPNGIADALYAIVWSMYGWGDAFLYITSRYTTGYPSAWTVLDPAPMNVEVRDGLRRYRHHQQELNPQNVVQITRNPTGAERGTSAIKAYAPYTNGLLAAGDLTRVMMGTTVPQYALRPKRTVNEAQALALQNQWVSKTSTRGGAPPVLPPDMDLEKLGFSPEELLLLGVQTFNSQVIATAYGIPAVLVNLPLEGGLNYQTPVLALELWWRSELRTTAGRITSALNSTMLPAGQYVEIDARDFLAPSYKELIESWEKVVAMGAATPEEFRAAVLKLPPSATLEDISTPVSAGASPAQQPDNVTSLRPSATGSY
jgi:hypothetical protein